MFPDPVTIKAGGRDIAVEDAGPGGGFPIFMMNGSGSRHLFGPAEDDSAFYLPWRFDLADIRAPVSLWHGLKAFLPIAHARWLADRIPHVTTHFPAGEDHTNIEEI